MSMLLSPNCFLQYIRSNLIPHSVAVTQQFSVYNIATLQVLNCLGSASGVKILYDFGVAVIHVI